MKYIVIFQPGFITLNYKMGNLVVNCTYDFPSSCGFSHSHLKIISVLKVFPSEKVREIM